MSAPENPQPINFNQASAQGDFKLTLPPKYVPRFQLLQDRMGGDAIVPPRFTAAAVLSDEMGQADDGDLCKMAFNLNAVNKMLEGREGTPVLAVSKTSMEAGVTGEDSALYLKNINSALFEVAVGVIPVTGLVRAEVDAELPGLSVWPREVKPDTPKKVDFLMPGAVLLETNMHEAKQVARGLTDSGIVVVGDRPIEEFFRALTGDNRGIKGAADRRRVALQIYDVLDRGGFDHLPSI